MIFAEPPFLRVVLSEMFATLSSSLLTGCPNCLIVKVSLSISRRRPRVAYFAPLTTLCYTIFVSGLPSPYHLPISTVGSPPVIFRSSHSRWSLRTVAFALSPSRRRFGPFTFVPYPSHRCIAVKFSFSWCPPVEVLTPSPYSRCLL